MLKKLKLNIQKNLPIFFEKLKSYSFSLETLNNSFEVIKSAALSLIAVGISFLVALTIYRSVTSKNILVEPLQVPQSFIEKGFTPEITSTRMLDEVGKIYNISSVTSISRKSVGSKQPGEDLSKLQALPVVGAIDLNTLQSAIQGAVGIQKEKITGEITYIQNGNTPIYQVRMRSLPSNKLLVDFSKEGEIPDIIKETAIKLVEQMDPVVASSYYRWSKDLSNSLRMIDEALRNDEAYDDKFALIQRASTYIQRHQFEIAQEDINQVLAIDPDFPWAFNLQSYLFNEQKKFKEGLEYSQKAQTLLPGKWQPHANMAVSLQGLGDMDGAEREFLTAISLSPTWALQYEGVATFLVNQKKYEQAEKVFRKGIRRFPSYAPLLLAYVDFLSNKNRMEEASFYLVSAYKNNPDDPKVLESYLKFKGPKDPKTEDEVSKKLENLKNSKPTSMKTSK